MGQKPHDDGQLHSSESTTPTSSELTTPYDSTEIGDLSPEQVKLVLTRISSAPLRLRSDNLVARPWGGRRLIDFKGLQGAARPGRYGESFEVAADPVDPEALRYPSIVEFEDGSSMRLIELLGRAGEAVLGLDFIAAYGVGLPLLPKFLDIEGLLSIQSHPVGHPEAYVIIDCEPGATIRLGFCRAIDPAQTVARLRAARATQERLAELFWMAEPNYAPIIAEFLGRDDGVRRLSERLAPMLTTQDLRGRLVEALTELDACHREMLDSLNVIEVQPGMVVFNADPPGAVHETLPSAQVHCLGNPEGKAILMLEVRKPAVTHRAWDHVRFPLRELEIEEAFASMSVAASDPASFCIEPRPLAERPGVRRSVECPAFVIDHLSPRPGASVEALTTGLPSTLHGLRGVTRLYCGEHNCGLLRAGESVLLPAHLPGLRLEAQSSDAELVQVTIPLPELEPEDELPTHDQPASEESPAEAKHHNLARTHTIVHESLGPTQVIAIVNPGDGPELSARLRTLTPAIFRADADTQLFTHEERSRRGQLLGLLDALRAQREQLGGLDPDRVALGIMLPGRGTRLSPLSARLHGIKPLFPMPIRGQGREGPLWLDGAAASLWSWAAVCWTLERQGFRGVAWKWGDEAQVAARRLSSLDYDLADVDAVRFGARTTFSGLRSPAGAGPSREALNEDLARNKEWLVVDPQTGELRRQLRRRPLAELEARLDTLTEDGPAEPYVHIGSPAFSHLLLTHAEHVFGDLEGWLDVDGYLFEALTHTAEEWAAERARDPQLRELLEHCPDFHARARELRRRVEADRGHAMRIVVIDFGPDPYWGDVGQLPKARAVWAALADKTEHGAFARELAAIADIEPDAHGNILVGDARVPSDGSVRDCVIIDSVIGRGRAEGAVVVRSKLGLAGLEPGAVAIDCHVDALRLERDSLAFASIGEYLRVPAEHAHTTIIEDPLTPPTRLESWIADMRVDVGAAEFYEQPCWGNPMSFAGKFRQMRQREVDAATIEARMAKLAARHGN